MSTILAIDPGPEKSSWVVWDGERVTNRCHMQNDALADMFIGDDLGRDLVAADMLAIEMIAPMGLRVGAEVFETAYWVGRFVQSWAPRPFVRIERRDVKTYLCGTQRCKDADIRAAIIRKFFGDHVDTRPNRWPAPLDGITTHMWSALAVALTAANQQKIEAAFQTTLANGWKKLCRKL
jgi:hypothetical protein